MSVDLSRGAAVLLLLLGAGCAHRQPVLPRQGWMLEERKVTANSLTGIVLDPSGAPRQGTLIQLLSSDKRSRIASRHTDARGMFQFPSTVNQTYLLRVSDDGGFNDIDLTVTVVVRSGPLKVTLTPSN